MKYAPLRYPGGKGKLAAFAKRIIVENGLADGHYVEPYAGGAAIALELLFQGYVNTVHINDFSKSIYAFWHSIISHTERFLKEINDIPLTVEEWDIQKAIFKEASSRKELDDLFELGFATFYLNRTNRSGILNGGIIGGRSQASRWGIGARFNKAELSNRIKAIGNISSKITLTHSDAVELISYIAEIENEKTLIYFDPPYYVKGGQLYYDYYKPNDHKIIADLILGDLRGLHWIVSYDNVQEIRDLYAGAKSIFYNIAYSARSASLGSEVMFFSDGLKVPDLVGAMQASEDVRSLAA